MIGMKILPTRANPDVRPVAPGSPNAAGSAWRKNQKPDTDKAPMGPTSPKVLGVDTSTHGRHNKKGLSYGTSWANKAKKPARASGERFCRPSGQSTSADSRASGRYSSNSLPQPTPSQGTPLPRGGDGPERFSRPRDSAPPALEQLKRESQMKESIAKSLQGFISTVTRVGSKEGKKTIWTTLPTSIQTRYGLEEMFTQDGWKQLCRGNVQVDISTYKVGDKIQMLVQSIGLGGRMPIIRGVPDPDIEEQRHTLAEFTPGKRNSSHVSSCGLSSLRKCGKSGGSYIPPSLRNGARAALQAESGTNSRFPTPSARYTPNRWTDKNAVLE